MRVRRVLFVWALATMAGAAPPGAAAQTWTTANATTAGRFIVGRPTLLSLGFEWMIAGDANGNARVDVAYRRVGDTAWRDALPLLRLHPDGPDNADSNIGNHGGLVDYEVPNAFAGSVLNLEPGTRYEARFTLTDPDGVSGNAIETAMVVTRAEPVPAAGGQVYHVYPNDHTGPKQEPSFVGLLRGYYTGVTNGDRNNSFPPRVRPGDTILVHAGVYQDRGERNLYNGNTSLPIFYGLEFDGTYYLRQSGTPDKPIVIKGAGDGETIFDGDGVAVLFDLTAASYNYFEGITFRNVGTVFQTGRKGELGGASGLTLKHCKIENVGRGVFGDWAGSKDFYIADNVFLGRHDPTRMLGWSRAVYADVPGFPPPINGPGGSELAVKVYGQGHVVAYNRVANFHDGIDIATYGAPDGAPDHVVEEDLPGSIDFYGNDMDNFADNCFEVDGGARNIRVFRNRCANSASAGLSDEPSFGGPFYAYQNLVYNNVSGTLKGGWGALVYHNTVVGEIQPGGDNYPANMHFRNNLLLGIGSGEVLRVITDQHSSSDYNGFRLNPGAEQNFAWVDLSKQALPAAAPPPPGSARRSGATRVPGFKTLEQYTHGSGQDRHSLLIDYSDFVKASGTNRRDPTILYDMSDYDFRLRPDSRAIDAGTVLATINDGFTGKAPDLGAYEFGKPVPQYGPRPPATAGRGLAIK